MSKKIFKSINLIRRGGGASLNLFRYTAMVFVLLMLGVGNAWAGHDQHTATLNVAKGTGNGSVYASTSATATSGSASASFNCGKSSDGQHTGTLYAYATPASGYTFLGWTTSASSSAGADNANPKGVAFDVSSASSSKTLYAHFVEKAKVNITFEAPSNGTYTIAVNGGSAETVSSANVVKSNVTGVTLTATPASGYAFAGWYKLNSAGEFVEDLSIASPYDASFTASGTIRMGARFVPVTLGKFILKGSSTQYYGLKMATIAAGGSGTIVPVADETLVDGSDLMPFDNGTYTIKAGATLLVPHTADNKMQLEPDVVTTAETLSAYRTLVLKDGVKIVSNGNICVGGKIMSAGGGNKSAYVTGPCGVINMANGGHIELNSGAKLYCWGFIKGQDMDQGNNTVGVGTITAHSGAIIKEDFEVGDWRGGTATYAIYNKQSSWKLFPFQSYSIQNVEVPTTYEYGSTLNTFVVVNGGGGDNPADFDIAGSSNTLFLLKDAQSTVRKWYDPTTDLTCYELSGTAKLDALNIEVYISVSSSDYYLPISNSMHIILKNCNMTLSKPMTMQAGSVIEIKEDATANLESRLHMFDKDEWGKYIHDYYFRSFNNLTSHKNRGAENSKDGLEDAKIIVDGTLNVVSGKGYLYSTNGGANIMGNGGGKVVFGGALPSSTTLHHVTVGTKAQSYIVDAPNDIAAANLCNEDGSYTKSIGSSTFHNVHGRWFVAANKDERANHTYAFKYMANGNSGDDVPTDAVYAPDKTGLAAGMKWCNVSQDATCTSVYNATQSLNGVAASDIKYTYPSDAWLQLRSTETANVFGGSDNNLYAQDGCTISSLGSVDENCLYTINDVKKALVDGHFVALEKNTEDEAWHDVANPTNYYISFAGCTWHPATKYAGEEKAYIVEEGDYIWYNNDWLLVEREDPFFFDYNDQNVKRYYEYEDGAWVLASPRVRVVDAIETRDFYKLPEAITVASGKKNTTITILKDISGINTRMTYTAKNTTCTLDLNGHTVSGAAPFGDDNNRGLLIINASGTTFTITDNSANKEGRLENICNQNKVTYTVHLMAGTLNLNAGTIYAQNLHQYRYKKNASDNVTGMGTRAVQVAAAQKFNITGGRVEANGKYEVYGIVANGSAANQTVVDISGTGEVYAEGALNTYGIACGGKLNLKSGLVEAHLNSSWANSYNTEGSDADKKAHATCRAISMSAKANATASSCYYGTLTVTGGTIKASTDATLALSYTSNVYGIYMNINVAGMGNRNFASTSGTNAQQASSIGSVKNAEIIVDNKANYGYGISVYGHYNSYNNSNSVFKVENTTVDVKAYNYAYGIYACGGIDGTTGECYTGDVEMTNCTVTAEATTASYAYGALVYAGQTTIYKDKQANYYGEYATAAKMTINGGTITAKAKSHYAYATTTSTRAKTIYSPENSAGTTIGEGIEAYPTLIINGGTYNATTGGYYARGVSSGGNTTISDATFNVTAGSYYAYGLYAVSGKLTATNVIVNNTAKGRVSSSDNNAYAYGVYADCGIISSGNQAWTGYTYASDVELNNCTVTSTATTYNNARGISVEARQALLTQANFDKQKTTSSWTDATYNLYASVFPGDNTSRAIASKATVNGGTFTATAKNATAYGAISTKTVITNTQGAMASPEMTLNNATVIANVTNKSGAYGIYSGGSTTINGCTITATAKTTTASGVLNVDKTTTIKNSTITATATDAAYGLEGRAEINATHGYCWHGDFDLSEAGSTTVTAEAKTSGKTAYTIYLQSAKNNIATGGAFDGDYATAANATINGGTYKAIASGSGSKAYVISLGSQQTQGAVVAQPEVEILNGFFNGATAEVGTAGVVGHMQLKGGYFVHPTNLATYAVAPKKVLTLRSTHTYYPAPYGYRYTIGEGGTVTWKNGTTTLEGPTTYEKGETPVYEGATPTKDADASYTYTHNGWTPAVSAMANSDVTYTATFSQTEKTYTVSVAAGANGSVSPSSVSGIGCETASGDISATPNTGYQFAGWTLPAGVTAASGYTVNSNPIHIHATASGKTITANFAAKDYTVTLDNQSATTAGAASVTATYNEAMPSITANLPAKAGYAFGGYFTETDGGGTQYYNADGTSAHIWDIDAASPTLYAKWTLNKYSFTIGVTPSSYGNVDVASITQIPHGSAVTVTDNKFTVNGTTVTATPTATTAEYTYAFSKWNNVPNTVTANVTNITAEFTRTINQYTLTVEANDDAMGTVSGGGTYDYNTVRTITASPKDGYKFVQWNDESTDNPRTVTVTANATYTATFDYDIANYTVKHWKQNIYDDDYTEEVADRQTNLSGTIGAQTNAEAKTYTGFTAQPISQQTIVVEGTTVVNIYYNRETYLIIWDVKLNGKQEAYKEETLRYGAIPSYGDDPTKAETAQYTYSFSGWSPTPYAADKDQTYSGSFYANTRYYTIKWKNWNGEDLRSDYLQYGAQVTYGGSTPTKTDSETERSYTFKGWSPEVVDVAGDATYTAQFDLALTIGEGENPYVVSGEETATITTVLVQGALKVPDGNNLTTNDLIIMASADNSGDVEGVERVSVTDHAYFDYVFDVDPWHWSAFGVPFEIDLDEFAPLNVKETTTRMVLGTDYDIVYYNTKTRAEQGPGKRNWEYVENHEHKLIPGMAYLIAFNHPVGHVNTVRFTKASLAPINYTTAVPLTVTGAKDGDNNWNGIANPKMYHALLDAGVEECQVHDGGPINGDGYHMYTMREGTSDYKFFVGKAAFVQTPQEKSVVKIDPATIEDPIKQNAPRRAGVFEAVNPKYDIRIAPIDGEMADRLFIRAEEGKEDDYVIVADLAKAGVSPKRAQLWVDRYGYQLCKNTTALINDMATYPLGISVPQAGEYSLYMANEVAEDDNLYLTYDGRVIWNLGYAPYVLSLEKGVNEHYGLRLIHNTPAMELDVEQVEATRAAQKMLIDQKVYILRGEQLYSITGQKAE